MSWLSGTRSLLRTAVGPPLAGIQLSWYARDVPSSHFSDQSTAEEVTAALDLTGLNALVTGCNSGIGYETMRVLALRGANVLGAAPTAEKGKVACASIEGSATPLAVDLADFDSIVECANEIDALDVELDMIVCNAGILLAEPAQARGLERHFVVNHLGHSILVNRLLPRLLAARAARVVVTGSSAYGKAPDGGIQFQDLSSEKNWHGGTAYFHSKLANGLFSLELARRFRGTNATSNCVNPGAVDTNIFRHVGTKAARNMTANNMKSVARGAATSCYVATHPSLDRVSGIFFVDCKPAIPMMHMRDTRMANELWRVSEDLVRDYLR